MHIQEMQGLIYIYVELKYQICQEGDTGITSHSLVVSLIPCSGKFSNGANLRIIRKCVVSAKIKTFEILFSVHMGLA